MCFEVIFMQSQNKPKLARTYVIKSPSRLNLYNEITYSVSLHLCLESSSGTLFETANYFPHSVN
jgi:hypothetical protein